MSDSAATVSPSILDAWLQVLGAIHPLIVHFPIALAIVAAMAMLLHWIGRHEGFGDFAFHCTWIAALASVSVAASGWFFADASRESNELFLHRWFGIGSSVGLIALAFMTSLVRGDSWPGLLKISRFASLLVAAGIGITAHFGGDMVWGEGQVTTPLSQALSVSWASIREKDAEVATAPTTPATTEAPTTPAVAPISAPTTPTPTTPTPATPTPTTPTPTTPAVAPESAPETSTTPATPATTEAPKLNAAMSIHDVLRMSVAFAMSATQTTSPATTPPATTPPATTPPATAPAAIPKDLEYNKNILPILEARCWDCHGKGVAKGGVAFDHVAELIVKEPLVKSKHIPIILVGKPASSAMMKAIQKPITAKGHMPPKGARLTAEQIALIEAWIQQGAKVVNP
jgi:uncharacterized membrane protein/mono/diheme cytochrome c family protein